MKYFTIGEMLHSGIAIERKINNYTISQTQQYNMIRLIEGYLDPIREMWGAPIYISSGFRCPELNARLGGSPSSFHLLGLAADLYCGSNEKNRNLAKMIALYFDFDQLIDEQHYTWIHFSIGISENSQNFRREILRCRDDVYSNITIGDL